jgi:hypothetical protein
VTILNTNCHNKTNRVATSQGFYITLTDRLHNMIHAHNMHSIQFPLHHMLKLTHTSWLAIIVSWPVVDIVTSRLISDRISSVFM